MASDTSAHDKPKTHFIKVYLWVLTYMKPYIRELILLILCGAAVTVGEMAVPRFIQTFIDTIIPNSDYRLFRNLSFVIIAALAVMFVANAAENILQRIIREKAARDLQYSVFRYLRKLGFSYYEQHPVGETLSLLNTDVMAVQKIYKDYLPSLIQEIIFIIIPFAYVLAINVKLTLLSVFCFMLYYLIGPYFLSKAKMYLKWQIRDLTLLNKKTYDSISAIPEIRAYAAEDWDKKRYVAAYTKFRNTRMMSLLYRHFRGCTPGAVIGLGTLVMYWVSAQLVKNRAMTVGELVAFSIYYVMVVRGINQITNIYSEQYHTLYNAKRLFDFMKINPSIIDPPNPKIIPQVKGHISLRNIGFQYSKNQGLISGFSLDIQAGEKVALVGTSGNGKSTLLKMIARFYDPDAGEILLDGIDLKELSLSQIHDSIGIVFQETYLFGASIRENIRFGNPEADDDAIIQAAKAAYAHEFIMETPQGYDTTVGERGIKLSGGQRQRIAIARMFLKDPKVILLDEATSALDNVSEAQVKNALNSLMKGRTTVAVAHRLSTVMNYDKIVVVDGGKAVESGDYQELLSRKALFYRLAKGGERNL